MNKTPAVPLVLTRDDLKAIWLFLADNPWGTHFYGCQLAHRGCAFRYLFDAYLAQRRQLRALQREHNRVLAIREVRRCSICALPRRLDP